MRLIDGDTLQAQFCQECIGECACCVHAIGDIVDKSCGLIEDAPTIDAEAKPQQ